MEKINTYIKAKNFLITHKFMTEDKIEKFKEHLLIDFVNDLQNLRWFEIETDTYINNFLIGDFFKN